MDIRELEDFNISDAVKFHDELNPALWDGDKLRKEVKEQLIEIADDFLSELGISGLKVKDITVSGSNAAYTYTPYSDLDLHILVDFNELPDDEIYQELFTAKKSLYNDSHDIKVHGVPVELYVQDSNKPVVSVGEYSLKSNDWLKYPSKRKANFNQSATRAKYEKLGSMIELALRSDSIEQIDKVTKIIKQYRQAGLDKQGEFGPENLAFKALRNMGMIKKLYNHKNKIHSRQLSIEDKVDPTYNVNEILDTKSKAPFYSIHGAGVGDKAVPFKTKSGNAYEIEFISAPDAYSRPRLRQFPKIKPKLLPYQIDIIDNGVEVVFREDNYMVDDPAGITGAGSAAEVFGIVTNKIVEYIKKFNPPYLYFTSFDDEPSRVKLYNALLKRVMPTLSGYFYKVIKIEKGYQFVILDTDFFVPKAVNEILDKDSAAKKIYWSQENYKLDSPNQMYTAHTAAAQDKNKNILKYNFYHFPKYDLTAIEFSRAVGPWGDNFSIDNAGDQYTVFATLLETIKQYLSEEQPKYILFGAKEPNRAKLYQAFINRFANKFGYKQISTNTIPKPVTSVILSSGDTPFLLQKTGSESVKEASGYIPSKKEKNDLRFKTALTVDVKPDSIKKNAKAFGFNVTRAGIPPLLRK